MDPNFPLAEWDRLIHQTNITLNLLRSSRSNPKLSAYSYIHGQFNFLTTPLAPPGTKVVAYINPEIRGTYELNGEVGWYTSPSLHHYRCVKVYFTRTRKERDCDIVEFFPHDIPFPSVSLKDHLHQAADDIVNILTEPPSSTVPSLKAGDPTRNAILELAQLLKRAQKIPEHIQEINPSTIQSSPRVQMKKK